MARLEVQDNSDLTEKLQKLGNLIDKYAEPMLKKAAEPLKEAVKSRLSERQRTGALYKSVRISKPSKGKVWSWRTSVMFSGKDENGVRNGLKAGVLEYGKHGQQAFPFVEASKNDAEQEVTDILRNELEEALRQEGLI